jgi:hypothetical protein
MNKNGIIKSSQHPHRPSFMNRDEAIKSLSIHEKKSFLLLRANDRIDE